MRNRLLAFMERTSGPWTLVILLILALGLLYTVNFVDLAASLPALAKITHARILDLSFFYQADEVYRRFALLGERGRQLYLQILWKLDIAIPMAYALALAMAIHMGWRARYAHHKWLRNLFLIPLAAGLFDYGENITIAFLLLTYPVHYPTLANLAGFITAMKWIAADISVVAALAGGLVRCVSYFLRVYFPLHS